jgi:hypothetical protein
MSGRHEETMRTLNRTLLLALLIGAGALLSSCVVRGGAMVHTSPAYQPQLVEVSPGIWVVEDYHYSVFYSDGYYWRYHNNIWYRSHVYNGGWVHVGPHYVPHTIIRIQRPGRYVRYRGHKRVRRRPIRRGSQKRPPRSNRPRPKVYRNPPPKRRGKRR